MGAEGMFDSCVRTAGDLAGVFEYDGETAFFYLYKTRADQGRSVLASLPVSGQPDFTQEDIAIRWDAEEAKVGLFIRDELWAVFDSSRNNGYGGNYKRGEEPTLPIGVERSFSRAS